MVNPAASTEEVLPQCKDDGSYCRNWLQILAIVIASLSSLTAGMLFSWPSPSIPQIINDPQYGIDLAEASFFTVLPPMGQIASCLVFSQLNDRIGRKFTLILIAIPQITSWSIIALSKSLHLLYLARFITGIGDAGLFATLPIYVAEISTPNVRGTWGNAMTFTIYVGQLFINLIGSQFSIQNTALICLFVPILFGCTFIFMPESPYYLLQNGRRDAARFNLQKLRQTPYVDEELDQLQKDVDRQISESGTWRDLFAISSNRRAIFAGVFLRASQQLGGISTFAVYTQYIFIRATGGTNIPPIYCTIGFLMCCVVLNFFAAFTLERIGRRYSYIFSCFLCGLVLLGQTLYFYLDQYYSQQFADVLKQTQLVPIIGMLLYIVFYSFGLGIVPTLMLGELFSSSIKGKGLCVLNIIFAILVSLSTKSFHLLETNFGLYCPFLLFGCACLTSSVLAVWFVPETKGCFPSVTAGMLFGWTSPAIPEIITDPVHYNITLNEASYFTVLPAIGQISTCFFYWKLNERIGRKFTLLLIAVPQMISWILISSGHDVRIFYLSRILNGIADAGLFATLPIYIAEIATPEVRGTWGNTMTIAISIGQFFVNFIGCYTNIRTTALICLIVPILFVLSFVFMPQSPYYLLQNGRSDAARLNLRRLRRKDDVNAELEQLQKDVDRQISEASTWRDLFLIRSNRRALLAGIFLRTSQQFAGMSSFTLYTKFIFDTANKNRESMVVSSIGCTLIFHALSTALNLFGAVFLDKFGRRTPYTYSCFLSGLSLLPIVLHLYLKQFLDLDQFNWIPLVGMLFYVIFYSFGLGIIPTLMLGELYSASIKSKALCVLNIVFPALVSLTSKLFHVLDANYGLYAPFLLFSVMCLVSGCLTGLIVPETAGKTLEQIQQDLKL